MEQWQHETCPGVRPPLPAFDTHCINHTLYKSHIDKSKYDVATSGFKMCFCYRVPAPLVLAPWVPAPRVQYLGSQYLGSSTSGPSTSGAGGITRLESSMAKLNPHLIHDCLPPLPQTISLLFLLPFSPFSPFSPTFLLWGDSRPRCVLHAKTINRLRSPSAPSFAFCA